MGYDTSRGPPIVPLVPARSALALSGPARTVSRCPAATRTACPRTSRPAALPYARCLALHPAPSCPAAHASHCPALRPARCPALQLTSRTALPCSPARHALLPCPLQPARRALLPRAPRPTAARASRPAAARTSRLAALHSACPAALSTARPALQPVARPALPSPPPSHPDATTAAAARVTAAGAGGAAGSAGGAAGARGAGPTTDCHCLSWPLSRQLQWLGVDNNSHCLAWTTPPLSSFSTFSLQRPRDCAPQRCVPGCVEAAALGSSESAAAQGAGESAANLGARESANALGASASTATGSVAASSRVSASGQLASSCPCRVLSHQTLLWHHCLGHPSLPHLRSMHSCLLFSGLSRSLHSLPRSPALPCLPCVEGRQRVAPHSSEFHATTAPLQTLHMDFCQDLPVLRLHSDRGGEFSSGLLQEFCRDEGIRQSFTLPASPQHNGIAERRIGLIMEVARISMIHADAPHFLWPDLAHTPVDEKVGDASVFRVWGVLSLVCDAKASKLSSHTFRCVFLGFPTDAPSWQFYHPRERRVFSSHDVTFDKSACFYRLHPHASHPVPLAPLLLVPVPPW
ncbi:unnamed protein product [Closterium sp. NIES-53]